MLFTPLVRPSCPPLTDRLRLRSRVDQSIRRVFEALGLLEVHVPSIVPCPGMEEHLDAFEIRSPTRRSWAPRWLHTSPEFAIKERFGELNADIYCMARVYRDEPSGPYHSPEFTMLEWYRRDADYHALMDDVERLIRAVITDVIGHDEPHLPARGATLALHRPWRRVRWQDAFAPFLDEDPLHASLAAWRRALTRAGIEPDDRWDEATLSSMLWAEVIEPSFSDEAIFLTEFPANQAALARLHPDDDRVAERFEAYLPGPWERAPGWGGIEIANAFSELINVEEQRARFDRCLAQRGAAGLPVFPMPEDMLAGIANMPRTAGIALGVDRLTTWIARAILSWDVTVADFYCTRRGGQ